MKLLPFKIQLYKVKKKKSVVYFASMFFLLKNNCFAPYYLL